MTKPAKTEKHTCEKRVWSGFSSSPHGVTAMYEHEGKWYCKTHHPPNVNSKRDESRRKWRAEQDAWVAAQAKAEAIRKAEQLVLKAVWAHVDQVPPLLYDAMSVLEKLGWEPKP